MIFEIIKILKYFIEYGILIYSIVIFSTYVILAVFSALEMVFYMRKNSFVDYSSILSSPLAPSISIIAPAYNEGKTIVENIRSLLSAQYPDFDVIIVNDGSKDNSLEKIIKEYDLELVDYAVNYQLETKPIKGVYKSRNKAFSRLIVIDKENGGKADSLNAGINVSNKTYFAAIDVDCVLEEDALLRMSKSFMEHSNRKVIATGGVIRIANNCRIEGGKIVEVNFPKQLLPRFQVLEYTRAFLMGRMAWSRINGLLLISGAFGLFDKDTVIKCGGYNHNTVGEDMELVVRMRRYMHETNQKYRVVYIPDPLCWTEAPSDLKTLGRQRNRWTRGTIDTLLFHSKLFFNKKYGILGLLGYPYWFFFEWMAPLVETLGIFYFLMVVILSQPNWPFFFTMLGFVYFFAVAFTTWAFLFEELTFHKYTKKSDMVKIIFTALLEPIIYHPINVWFALRGNYHKLIGKAGWGKMVRSGFQKKVNS